MLFTQYRENVNFFNELAAALDKADLCADDLGLNGLPGCDSNLAQASRQNLELPSAKGT